LSDVIRRRVIGPSRSGIRVSARYARNCSSLHALFDLIGNESMKIICLSPVYGMSAVLQIENRIDDVAFNRNEAGR
jgi:hypothetical protein